MCQHRNGHDLSNKEAHQKDHAKWSRRSFLSTLGLAGTASMFLGKLPITAMASNPLSYALEQSENDRILILLRLAGGNDGLNTIIPLYAYDSYQRFRPNLAIPENETIKLSDEIALPNYMNPLMRLWGDGQMKVVNGVGYPDQDYSHFNSSQIWASASDATSDDTSGWMGRFLENEFPQFLIEAPEVPPVVQIGGYSNQVFNSMTQGNFSFVVSSAQELEDIGNTGEKYSMSNLPDCLYGDKLGFLRSVTNSTYIYTEVITEAYKRAQNQATYPTENDNFYSRLAPQLAVVARLIKGGLGTRIYMVELGGFDTHEQQGWKHRELMMDVAHSVNAFYQDLDQAGLKEKVLTMTFSEFGRTIQENGSRGTDHGAAAPLLFFGGELEGGGIEGALPSLDNLGDYDDFEYTTDFRSVYSTVLQDWLCVDQTLVDQVLGQSFARINGLLTACNSSPSVGINPAQAFLSDTEVRYDQSGVIYLQFNLQKAANIEVDLLNILGQPVSTLGKGYKLAGVHEFTFNPHQHRLPAGQYLYRIKVDGYILSGKVMAFQ